MTSLQATVFVYSNWGWTTPEHHVLLVRCGKWLAYVNITSTHSITTGIWPLSRITSTTAIKHDSYITCLGFCSAQDGLAFVQRSGWKTDEATFQQLHAVANSMIPCLAFLRYDLCISMSFNFVKPYPLCVFLSEIFFFNFTTFLSIDLPWCTNFGSRFAHINVQGHFMSD